MRPLVRLRTGASVITDFGEGHRRIRWGWSTRRRGSIMNCSPTDIIESFGWSESDGQGFDCVVSASDPSRGDAACDGRGSAISLHDWWAREGVSGRRYGSHHRPSPDIPRSGRTTCCRYIAGVSLSNYGLRSSPPPLRMRRCRSNKLRRQCSAACYAVSALNPGHDVDRPPHVGRAVGIIHAQRA
jgi:hypothetical protein